jgi:hypothetical protein
MSEAFAPEAACTAPVPDDREGVSERTVRIGTSVFAARLATAAAGARLPEAPALVVVEGGLLSEAARRMLDPRLAVAAGRVDLAPTCRPLDPALLTAAGWLRLAITEPVCGDDAAPRAMAGSGVAAARREASVVADCRGGADNIVSARPC